MIPYVLFGFMSLLLEVSMAGLRAEFAKLERKDAAEGMVGEAEQCEEVDWKRVAGKKCRRTQNMFNDNRFGVQLMSFVVANEAVCHTNRDQSLSLERE